MSYEILLAPQLLEQQMYNDAMKEVFKSVDKQHRNNSITNNNMCDHTRIDHYGHMIIDSNDTTASAPGSAVDHTLLIQPKSRNICIE